MAGSTCSDFAWSEGNVPVSASALEVGINPAFRSVFNICKMLEVGGTTGAEEEDTGSGNVRSGCKRADCPYAGYDCEDDCDG